MCLAQQKTLQALQGSAINKIPNIPQCTLPPQPIYQTRLSDFSRVWLQDYYQPKLVYSLISKLTYNFNCEDFSEIIKPTYVALRFATRHVTPVYCKMGVAFRVAPYTT